MEQQLASNLNNFMKTKNNLQKNQSVFDRNVTAVSILVPTPIHRKKNGMITEPTRISYLVRNLKKVSIFAMNSKPFLGFLDFLRNL
jgi:hypothetical protein